jgi:hypothetical protein
VGKEADQRVRGNTESVEFDSVAISPKPAIRTPETLSDSAGQVQTKSLSDLGSEYTECGSGIHARRDWDFVRSRAEHYRYHHAFILTE